MESAGFSQRYLYEINRIIRLFFKFNSINDPSDIQENHVEKYLRHVGGEVRNQKYNRAILSRYLSYCDNNVIKKMMFCDPYDMRPNAHWLDEKQVEILLNTTLRPREELVLHLGLSMGLRACEMRRIKLEHIFPKHIDVLGKRRKWRSVPLSDFVIPVLKRYLEWRDQVLRGKSTPYLMVGPRSLRLSYKGLDRDRRLIVTKSGVNWTIHDLRRTWGRNAFEHNVPLLKISFVLGHSSEMQTVKYLGLRMSDGMDAIQAVDRYRDTLIHSSKRGN